MHGIRSCRPFCSGWAGLVPFGRDAAFDTPVSRSGCPRRRPGSCRRAPCSLRNGALRWHGHEIYLDGLFEADLLASQHVAHEAGACGRADHLVRYNRSSSINGDQNLNGRAPGERARGGSGWLRRDQFSNPLASNIPRGFAWDATSQGLASRRKRNRAVGSPTARALLGLLVCRPSYRTLITAGPSIDNWLPLWIGAKNALTADPVVPVLV